MTNYERAREFCKAQQVTFYENEEGVRALARLLDEAEARGRAWRDSGDALDDTL